MHRHGYQGRKFGRERDQRQALIAGLANSLVLEESVKTTLSKAKETARYLEKLITKAKQNSLHSRRQVISKLTTLEASHKLVDDIAPKLGHRSSGYLRIKRTVLRRGDGVQLAKISFVDDLKAKPAALKKPAKQKPSASQAAAPKTAKGVKK